MSAKLDIFNDIVTALSAVSTIQAVELWNSQLDNEAEEVPINYPAVFVEFAEIPWTDTNQSPPSTGNEGDISKEQKAIQALVTLHIAFSQIENETISFPIISPIIDDVYFAIQGLGADKDYYGPLKRIVERQDTDHNRVIDWQVDFLTALFQCGKADTTLEEISVGTLDIETNVDMDIDNEIIRSGDGTVL